MTKSTKKRTVSNYSCSSHKRQYLNTPKLYRFSVTLHQFELCHNMDDIALSSQTATVSLITGLDAVYSKFSVHAIIRIFCDIPNLQLLLGYTKIESFFSYTFLWIGNRFGGIKFPILETSIVIWKGFSSTDGDTKSCNDLVGVPCWSGGNWFENFH